MTNEGRGFDEEGAPMTVERIWLLINKRRADRGKLPVKLSAVQRIVRLMLGEPPKPLRAAPFSKASFPKPPRRWDLPAPQGGRPAFKSDNRR